MREMVVEELTRRNKQWLQHVDAIEKIERKSFPRRDCATMPSVQDELKKRNNRVFVSLEDGRVVGYVIFSNKASLGYIVQIAVMEAFRRRGIAENLLEECLAALGRQRCNMVQLHVEIQREGAVRLYEKVGFVGVQELSDYYGEGRHAYWMQLT